jgi:hypothetical protein
VEFAAELLASDTRHALYRANAERWLESIAREDITRIEAMLDQRFVYAQALANAGGEHGILDLLTVTRSGRLAIIELKASEHLHLPLQAADYWLRVRRQLQSGAVTRYGYFPGIALQQASPIVYLVAPALRFHPATDDLLSELSPELEIVRVGLAESWAPQPARGAAAVIPLSAGYEIGLKRREAVRALP